MQMNSVNQNSLHPTLRKNERNDGIRFNANVTEIYDGFYFLPGAKQAFNTTALRLLKVAKENHVDIKLGAIAKYGMPEFGYKMMCQVEPEKNLHTLILVTKNWINSCLNKSVFTDPEIEKYKKLCRISGSSTTDRYSCDIDLIELVENAINNLNNKLKT